MAVHQRPIYLYVPEAHQRDWRHHCAAYGACGQPVYFVREQWVHDRYVQHYPHDHRYDHWDREHGYGPGWEGAATTTTPRRRPPRPRPTTTTTTTAMATMTTTITATRRPRPRSRPPLIPRV